MAKANGGVGFALAALLLADASKHVLLGSRSVEKGETAVKELQSREQPGSVELLHLDVDSEDSIIAAAKSVESKYGRSVIFRLIVLSLLFTFSAGLLTDLTRLDALVNNAAIGTTPGSTAQQMAACFKTNATGPQLMSEYFVPLLHKANGTPRIVNVSSGAGSISRRLDPNAPKANFKDIHYRTSKAALNMVSAALAADLGPQGFKVFVYNPGFSISGLGPHNNAKSGAKPASEGAAPIVNILNGERDAEHGKFLNLYGQYPAW